MLSDCFRCTPAILSAATNVLAGFSPPTRIPKGLASLYGTANPPVQGHAHWWKYSSPAVEAAAIAQSCVELHSAGMPFGDMMILLGNRRVVGNLLQTALTDTGVPFSPVQSEQFRDTSAGRAGFSILRIVSDEDDLVARRNLLALLPQMGPQRCLDVTQRCVAANMNADDLYRHHIPNGVLTNLQLAKVQTVRAIVTATDGWDIMDTVAQRGPDLAALVEQVCGVPDRQEWEAFVNTIPADATLRELCDLLFADNIEDTGAVLTSVHERLDLPVPPAVDPDRVQVLTMHGAKGLSAKVVFVPGLEEGVFPNQRMAARPGLVMEGARLLYVSITRARAAVFLTGTQARNQNGAFVKNPVSRYLPHSGLVMQYQGQGAGVDAGLAQAIVATCGLL